MLNDITDEMYSELLKSEIGDLRDIDELVNSGQSIPSSVFMIVSNIAFRMAIESLNSGRKYMIAPILCRNTNKLYDSDKISLYDKNQLHREIGEMNLDFNYAGGNHNISSLRLSYYIRARHID